MWIQLASNQQFARIGTKEPKKRAFVFGKKRRSRTWQSSMPARRFGKHPNAKIYRWRRIILVLAVLISFGFAAKIVLSFFNAEYVSLEVSGNIHYTDVQIYNVLGEKLGNIVTDSEEQTADYLKKNLSYIKEARVVKHVMKRMLTIEITEREPFARLQFSDVSPTSRADQVSLRKRSVGDPSFFLIDREGHVLENIAIAATGDPWQAEASNDIVILLISGETPPRIGAVVAEDAVKFGLAVLKTALLEEPWLAAQIRVIDASDSQKIRIQLDALPIPVWLAGDVITSGLHQTTLFLKQYKTRTLELMAERSSKTEPYLDARYQDTLYLGGDFGSN